MDLDHLLDRNAAWVERKTRVDPTFFRRLGEQQAPKYLWIGCSDSRVTANDILDLDPGEVFVHRNISNMVHASDMNVLSVLVFAVETLRVRHVIVCGHYGCGGVIRAMANDRTALVDHWLQPMVMLHRSYRAAFAESRAGRSPVDRMCEINVDMQVRRLAAVPIVENAWARGQPLSLHGWIYGIHDGLLRDLGASVSSPEERDAMEPIERRILDASEPNSAMRRQAMAAFNGRGKEP
jgi:carbonic anhydrase